MVQSKKITTAIIPVAGLGTRMFPISKSIPKEMLPLVDKPIIQYIIDECIASGIHKIILVTNFFKKSVENYFNRNLKLESILKKKKKNKLLNQIKFTNQKNVKIIKIRQNFPKGTGHAILCARPLIGKKPFVVIFPDVVICDFFQSNFKNCNLKLMLDRYHKTLTSQILVKPIYGKHISKYGIVNFKKVDCAIQKNKIVNDIIEKPKFNRTNSNLSVVGRYILSKKIWDLLKIISKKKMKEIQLTDAIRMLMKEEIVEAYYLQGKSYDCGDKLGYMKAFIEYGIRNKILGKNLLRWIKKINL